MGMLRFLCYRHESFMSFENIYLQIFILPIEVLVDLLLCLYNLLKTQFNICFCDHKFARKLTDDSVRFS